MRLADLYKNGMYEFLEKKVTDFSTSDFEIKYKHLDEKIKEDLLKDITKLRLEKNNEFAIKEVFDKKSFTENAKVVKQVVELLQGFKIRYTKKQQYLSDFFELLLTTGLKQESGQFFTPVPIAQFIIKSIPVNRLIEEKLQKGEQNNLLPFVIDYAAGSGHFLTEIMHEVQRALDQKDSSKYISSTAKKIRNWQDDHFDWALQYVYGIEKDYRLVKVGKVGCYLHGDGLANVIHSDGLGNFKDTEEYKDQLAIADADFPKENKQFDLVVSNPPYSVQAFKQNARSYYTEKDFDLYERLTDNSSEIECLFVERTKQLLKDGGMAGIILPSSILSNTGIYTKTREIILRYFDIVAITELGSNTFMATGTNTVTLFLRRRNNYDSINLKKSVETFFTNLQDVNLKGIEELVSKYVAHVWEGTTLDDYKTLLQKQPNEVIEKHEIYQEYQKKIKTKKEHEKWNKIIKLETEKLFYFIISYPQKVVLVNTGQKKEEKQFLGYEFSHRRGSEGIHPIQRGKNIDECTSLFDADVFDNPEKASTYIYKAFEGDFDFPIHESLQKNISRTRLVDMLTFDSIDFDKNISLVSKKKIKIESKYDQVKLGNITSLIKRGKSSKYGKSNIQIIKSGQARGFYEFDFTEKHYVTENFQLDERQLQKGDLLLNSSGVGTAGRVTYFDLENDFVVDGHITILRFIRELVSPKYVLNIFGRIGFKNLESLALGQSGQIEMSVDTISNFKIPLPPKNIQEKIVSEMEVLEEKEQKIAEEIDSLKDKINEIVASFYNSKCKREKLGILATLITKGSSPTWQGISYTLNPEVLFVTSENVREGFLDLSKKKYLEKRFNEIQSRSILQKNDILINIVGASIGRAAIYTLSEKANINQAVALVRFKENILEIKLLNYFLNSIHALNIYNSMKKDVARANLSLKNISDIKIPLPSIPEQKKIISEIEKFESKITILQATIKDIPQQKEAILKQYL
jgi:type I restriction enzyme M protein